MVYCDQCGQLMYEDASGMCPICLSETWSELRTHANLWDLDALRATVDERPLPKPRGRRSRVGSAGAA